jgi:hypothetical protein
MSLTRFYHTVVDAILNGEDEGFDFHLQEIAEQILTPATVEAICAERVNVLENGLYCDLWNLKKCIYDISLLIHPHGGYTEVIRFFANADWRSAILVKQILLCCAAAGVIPITQPILGTAVEEFLIRAGEWETTVKNHKDAMSRRTRGSFEGGKRQRLANNRHK